MEKNAPFAKFLYFIIVSTIVAINTILNPSVAAASTESQYGKELKIAQDPVTEKLSFGAVYTLDADPDGMSLLITFRTNISDEELKSLPDNLHWNIIGPRDIAVPVTVQDAVIPKSALKVGQINVKSTFSIARAILSLKNGMLLFAKTPEETINGALFNIQLGDLCRNHADLFSNLTNNKSCKTITEDDVGGL